MVFPKRRVGNRGRQLTTPTSASRGIYTACRRRFRQGKIVMRNIFLVDCVPTINYKRMTLYEGRLRRAQKQNSISDFFRRSHSLHRRDVDCRFQCLSHCFRSCSHRRFDDARTDTVYANAVLRIINRISPRHVDDGGFRCAVRSWRSMLAGNLRITMCTATHPHQAELRSQAGLLC
jgi:hypothetical protein